MSNGLMGGCPTGILTKGLGLPAKNNLIFGLSRLLIKIEVTPTPTPTPTVTPTATPTGGNKRPGGAGYIHENPPHIRRKDELDEEKTIEVQFKWKDKSSISKTFKISNHWNNVIVKRINDINRVKYKFDSKFIGLKNRFNVKWKK